MSWCWNRDVMEVVRLSAIPGWTWDSFTLAFPALPYWAFTYHRGAAGAWLITKA
jgi:hypothetical protein